MKYKSFATWPNVPPCNGMMSEDTHESKEAAEAVCHSLEKLGFGGNGKVFPLKTWVEPVSEPICDEPFEDLGMNAIWKAIHDCGKDWEPSMESDEAFYEFVGNTPRTSLVVEVVNKLRENGFEIVKKT